MAAKRAKLEAGMSRSGRAAIAVRRRFPGDVRRSPWSTRASRTSVHGATGPSPRSSCKPRLASPTAPTKVQRLTRYEYDGNGNLTKLTDPRSAVTQTAFDALNRVKQVTDALNGVTKTAYDLRDNPVSVTDPRLHATTYSVNGFGFVTSVVSPDSGTTSFTYDLAGNVKSRTDARKIVTNYTYDALDRPLTRTFPSATAENVTFVYDATAGGNYGVGRMTSVTDAAGTASFVYDAYGNRFSEKRTIGAIAYNTSYGYDLAGNVTRLTYPSGLIVNYQRDGRGQVSGVTIQANAAATPASLASNIAYMPFGGLQSATLGNGVQLTNGYDLDYRLSTIQAAGATTLQNLTLGYDPASNVSSIADGVSASLSQTFQYDLLGHVTKGTGAFGTDNYTYDAMGNRLTRSLVNGATSSTTYTYTTASTRLASAATGSSSLSYTYDAMGSVTARKLGNTTQAAYTYNADARLATAAGATLKYNAFGQRQVETVTGGGTHFLFGPDGALLAEHNVTGALVRNYIYLNGKPLAVVDASGTVSYILTDHLGQPQKMLNASGAVTWHRVAGVYGDTVSQPVGTTSANPQRFPGQQLDATTGLHYNYYRDYDPATGRYLETDPIGLGGGINVYGYVGGNPVNRVDRNGKLANIVIGIGIEAIGQFLSGSDRAAWSNAWNCFTQGEFASAWRQSREQIGRLALSGATGGLGGAVTSAALTRGIATLSTRTAMVAGTGALSSAAQQVGDNLITGDALLNGVPGSMAVGAVAAGAGGNIGRQAGDKVIGAGAGNAVAEAKATQIETGVQASVRICQSIGLCN